MCAVENANIDCIKSLLAKGADVTLEADRYQPFVSGEDKLLNPIIKAIWMTGCGSKYPSVTMSKIFDLLLEAAVERSQDHLKKCRAYILCAIITSNNRYINKLIKIGAPLDGLIYGDRYVWVVVAKKGTVELLKSMINRGFDKNSKDQNGLSLLGHVVSTGNVEAIRYLLDLGVTIPSYTPKVREVQCEQCGENRLIIDDDSELQDRDPFKIAICNNNLEIAKLLDEYGSQTCKSFPALRRCVQYDSVDVTSYLLHKYTYPLNIEYTRKSNQTGSIYTILTEPRFKYSTQIISLLLDHGANPAKQMCSATSANAMMTAIYYRNINVIAQYIRSGVNINVRSCNGSHRNISPFKASVLRGYHNIAKMLLMSGCSRVVVHHMAGNHKFKNNLKPKVVKLMKEWKVQENNVTPLQQRCRCVILNHLSPRADKKIKKLPVPGLLIQFLNVTEIDDIVDLYNKNKRC